MGFGINLEIMIIFSNFFCNSCFFLQLTADFFLQSNRVLVTNSNFLISISFQHDGVNLWFLNLDYFIKKNYVSKIYGIRKSEFVAKIYFLSLFSCVWCDRCIQPYSSHVVKYYKYYILSWCIQPYSSHVVKYYKYYILSNITNITCCQILQILHVVLMHTIYATKQNKMFARTELGLRT